ncbi:MAG: NAD-glutamate dehydrogenase [Acidimicrobiia bacterium]|nr:MAG: NAD-glutamate dehydrogenase [Acidimicrobiia bacterium]
MGDREPSTPGFVEETLNRLSGRVPDQRWNVLEAFTRAYLKRLPPGADLDPDSMAGEVLSVFRFIERRSDELAVRALNPTRDQHGYQPPGTVVDVNVEDSPFLIDSVTNELRAHGLEVTRVMHPVIGTRRDPDGLLVEIVPARQAVTRESVEHYQLDRRLVDLDLPGMEKAVRSVLADVRAAVSDFRPMVDRVSRMIDLVRAGYRHYPEAEVEEAVAFLQWLKDDNFIFLGYREYRLVDTSRGPGVQAVPGSGLGILSDVGKSRMREPVPLVDLPPDLAARWRKGDLLVVTKSNRLSTVHRRVKMDYIGVRILSPEGETVGEARLLGLFTSKAYMEPASRIPLLRRKLQQILNMEDLIEGSHDHKAVVGLFDGFPKDELFAAPTEELRRTIVGLLALQERDRVRLFVRRDLLERSVSILVALPRDRFNAELRKQLQELFRRRFNGTSVDYHLSLGESDPAQIHFTVWVESGEIPDVPFDELDAEVRALTRSWVERLVEALAARVGETEARRLAERWAARLPEYYRTSTPIDIAAGDVLHLEELADSGKPFLVGVQNETGAGEEPLTRITLYRADGKRPLSELLPALEDLGVEVVEEVPTRLGGGGRFYIHDFGVRGPDGKVLDVEECGDRIVETLTAVWGGAAESDDLNRLVLSAGLDHRQVHLLSAYRTYWRRVTPAYTLAYINEALAAHPQVAADLVRLFEARFDPDRVEDPDPIRRRILAALEQVPSLDQDRILRTFLRLVEATVRTNAYRTGSSSLAFKFRSAEVPDVPQPVPFREIFVLAPDVEGIHLRGGPVARGGIRWSDRREDYRTEVLGLMKAQMTKNAVIVPTGAKGGFVLRRAAPPERLGEAVQAAYETFIRGLLDLTDNLVDGKVVHPPQVRVHDEPDPYLVVAADKGTARFSDIANRIAAEYGFWLGDAFASGGSTGYDHKKLGITARGAWKSLERHFYELGIDPARDTFTVVGIGDMSGDVFGNGMLLSDRMKLVAAFDHRHVFVDPDPDPLRSYQERRRLFELPGSSWADYDPAVLSEGGGVYPRSAKQIRLSPQARRVLGVDRDTLTPAETIKAILTAPVDLLWNGGIGTYVKAEDETHEQVGDRANDPVRVDASQLRCRVVVEGGNLGFTQRARIEYARRGGRINTDFIDNSAGVDCSDREVNFKILLSQAMAANMIDREERDRLIEEATDGIVERILYDNFQQAQILSQEERASGPRIDAYEQLMVTLEKAGLLDRRLEALPGTDEMTERAKAGEGMTRPELAVLLAYAKLAVTDLLLRSDIPDLPYLVRDLEAYFPMADRFRPLLWEHPLRRELIATLVANDICNAHGSTFVSRLVARTGADPAEVVRAHRTARDVAGAVPHWRAIEGLFGRIDNETWFELMNGADWVIATATRWFLSKVPAVPLDEGLDDWAAGFAHLEERIEQLGPPSWKEQRLGEVERLAAVGVPRNVARRHAFRRDLVYGPDVIDLARLHGREIADVATVMFHLGEVLELDRLERLLRGHLVKTPWQRWAVQTLEDDLMGARRLLAERIIVENPETGPNEALDRFLHTRSHRVERLVRFSKNLEHERLEDLAPLMVAVRQVRSLAR